MTLDEAVAQARAIQRDLDAGRRTVEDVKAELDQCYEVFSHASDEAAGELVRRLYAEDPVKQVRLPW